MLLRCLTRIWGVATASLRGFFEDHCYTKASTLTFYTLQSIVPFLAAMLAIAKGFGFDEYLESLLTIAFHEQKEVLTYAIEFALSTLKVVSSGEFLGIGVLLLLWTNLNLVSYIERAFNAIWKVKHSRSLFQRIKDFTFALTIFPIIFAASGSATLFLESQVKNLSYLSEYQSIIIYEIQVLFPWFLCCVLFGMLYLLIPNSPFRLMPRLIATLIAGTVFQLWQLLFINLQLYLFTYNVIYGAFALFPLFLIWLQCSWMIALAGAEIAANIENGTFAEFGSSLMGMTKIQRRELALLIMQRAVLSFYEGEKPLILKHFSEEYKVPLEVLKEVVSVLEENEVLISFINQQGQTCYHPFHAPSTIKLSQVCNLIDEATRSNLIIADSAALIPIRNALTAMQNEAEVSMANLSLSDLFREYGHGSNKGNSQG